MTVTKLERAGEALLYTYEVESRLAHALLVRITAAARGAVAFLGHAVSKVPPLT